MTQKLSDGRWMRGSADGVIIGPDIEILGATAYSRYREFDGSQGRVDDRLSLLALFVVCRIWTRLHFEMELQCPDANEGPAEFTAQLARQMELEVADVENVPTIGYIKDAFSAVAKLCQAIAGGQPSVLFGEEAFFAGLMVGAVQNTSSEVDQVAQTEMYKSFARERKRLDEVGKKALKKRRAMIELGLAEIAIDPTISNMALQRRFRAMYVKSKGVNTTSNNEARMFGRLRATEALPKRETGNQVSNPQTRESTETSSE